MRFDRSNLLLYAVTDRSWLGSRKLTDQIALAAKGGVTMVQLREKNLDYDRFVDLGKEIKEIANSYGLPFVVNDDIDVAIGCGADGVHVGQQDARASVARKRIGIDKFLGVSVTTVKEAIEAESDGANYLGVGSVFPTTTKTDAADVDYDTLKEICNSVSIPVVAIGGINEDNILKLAGSGIDGVAVVSAIFAREDIEKASSSLKKLVQALVSI